jgi:hypothetical protein
MEFDEKLINCIKTCLNNISSLSNLAINLSNDEVKKEIAKENEDSKNQKIAQKTNFEIIVNSIITLLGDDKFNIEKSVSPKGCPFCKNQSSSFDLNYIKINLDNYIGNNFSLEEFCRPVRGESYCRKCKKNINVEYNFANFPEILIIILGSKSYNKSFYYNYRLNLLNNNSKASPYVLKSLIGQIDDLKFKSFLFDKERDFDNNNEQYKNIFSCPTILFYEGPKRPNNEKGEYLQNNYLGAMDEEDNDDLITIYFNFVKHDKKIYLDINKNEKFKKAIIQLKEKHNWLKQIRNLKFYFNNKEVDNNKTLVENGITDNSVINII